MKNHYKIEGNVCLIYPNGKNKLDVILIDKEDLPLISNYSWRVSYVHNGNYKRAETSAVINGKHTVLQLGRFLLNAPSGLYVDHKNLNPLDNTRNNIRLCTPKENSRNAPKTRQKRSSIYKGVSWHKHKNKWIAMCAINSKNKFIGYFSDEIQAAKAYDIKAKELHGEFAKTNFPLTS